MEIPDERAGTWRLGKHGSEVKKRNAIFSLPSGGANVAHDPIDTASADRPRCGRGKGNWGVVNAESAAEGAEETRRRLRSGRRLDLASTATGNSAWSAATRAIGLCSESRTGRRPGERGEPLRWRFGEGLQATKQKPRRCRTQELAWSSAQKNERQKKAGLLNRKIGAVSAELCEQAKRNRKNQSCHSRLQIPPEHLQIWIAGGQRGL